MTMYQFLHALEIPNSRLELYASSGRQNDSLLRCFVADTAYASYRDHGVWKPLYEKYLESHVSDALLQGGCSKPVMRKTHNVCDILP